MNDPIIKLVDVWKIYSGEYVLKNISLDIYKGDYICIYGRSGVGKTSLLRLISLLTSPTKGKIFLYGKDSSKFKDSEKCKYRARYFGIILQGDRMIPTLTIYENIDLNLKIKGFKKEIRRKMIMDSLNMLDILSLAYRYPDTLSAGEYQRAMIARAISSTPDIILADEPLANLDDDNANLVMKIFNELNRKYDATIIFTTTESDEISKDFNRRYLIKDSILIEKT